MLTTEQKMNYVRQYIHMMKNTWINVNPPKNVNEQNLLNFMYFHAKNVVTSMGKEINV